MEHIAVCHVHSQWSYDGSWSLEALSGKFRQRGCRILMMTEHDRGFAQSRLNEFREACAGVSTDKILVIPGIEYSDSANRVHVLVWGRVPFLGEGLPTGEMLEGARAANGIAVLAHLPAFRL
jgi:predicted metal-dependent phosphoesterase TrpH